MSQLDLVECNSYGTNKLDMTIAKFDMKYTAKDIMTGLIVCIEDHKNLVITKQLKYYKDIPISTSTVVPTHDINLLLVLSVADI